MVVGEIIQLFDKVQERCYKIISYRLGPNEPKRIGRSPIK